jgi:hypothetical protein
MKWDDFANQTNGAVTVCKSIGNGALRNVIPCITPEDEANWSILGTSGAQLFELGESVVEAEEERIDCAKKLDRIIKLIENCATRIAEDALENARTAEGMDAYDFAWKTDVGINGTHKPLEATDFTDWQYATDGIENNLPDLNVSIENFGEGYTLLDEAITAENQATLLYTNCVSEFMPKYNEAWRVLLNRIKSGV